MTIDEHISKREHELGVNLDELPEDFKAQFLPVRYIDARVWMSRIGTLHFIMYTGVAAMEIWDNNNRITSMNLIGQLLLDLRTRVEQS